MACGLCLQDGGAASLSKRPFNAFHRLEDFFTLFLRGIQPLGILTHHGEPHRNVEPVEVMLGFGIQVQLHLTDVGSPVGKETSPVGSSASLGPLKARRDGSAIRK